MNDPMLDQFCMVAVMIACAGMVWMILFFLTVFVTARYNGETMWCVFKALLKGKRIHGS